MKPLIRHREEQDIIWSEAYNMLSKAGFELLVEDGFLFVWLSGCRVECDIEEGFVIVPDEYQEEFEERQEYLENQGVHLYENPQKLLVDLADEFLASEAK
jgi:hypothetical protein